MVLARATMLVAVVGLVALLVSSCGFLSSEGVKQPELSTTTTTSSISKPEDNGMTAVVDKVRVRAIPAPADRDRDLEVTKGSDVTVPKGAALVAATAPIRVTMDGGESQPTAPMELEFDLSDRPDIVSKLSDTVLPVVESVSQTDPNARDMFSGTWDPATKKLTAKVPHLTNFWVGVFDVLRVVNDGIGKTFEFLRGNLTSPCRERSELTIGGTDYVLTARSPGAIAGCLVDDDGSVAIAFENATGNFYSILVAPKEVGGAWVVTKPLSFDEVAGSAVAGAAPNVKGVLASRSSGRLTLPAGVTEADVRMMPAPHGILVKSLMAGLDMLGIDLGGFEDIPQAYDCIVSAVDAVTITPGVTTPELNEMIGDAAQCLILAQGAANAGDLVKNMALHRLSTAVALLTELPQQLWDFTAAGLQEAARDSVKDFELRSSTEEAPEPEELAPASTVIDRVDLTTWAYDRVEGDTYIADNTNMKQIEVFWKSYAGAEQVRGGCTSTVRIEGPGTNDSDDTSNCDSYDPGTYLKARAPGVHTITVTVRPDGQPEITAQRTVTVLPHR